MESQISEISFQNIPIECLLPQRAPFIFIDELVSIGEEETVTHYHIPHDGILTEEGLLTQSGITENIAQTCAARIGYYNYINKKEIRIGVIGAIRNLNFKQLPHAGEDLYTKITVKEEIFGMTMVEAVCTVKDQLIASCIMKIALR